MNKKMWSILVHLSMDMWVEEDGKPRTNQPLDFSDDIWDYILEESAKTGVNTIVLDVGNGIEFASHPEIVKEGAWTRARVRKEVARCRDLGIALIPKLNFSASHDMWLGVYSRMLSTPEYYNGYEEFITAQTIATGTATASEDYKIKFTVPNNVTTAKNVKFFVWDSVENRTPLTKAFEIE